jgi:tripartite-type tricarboxylate transporter receptor subunit TctC
MATKTLPASAADYPDRPITLIIPFPPGGSTTIVIRSVSDKLGEALGQQIVIDNRAGAGGTVGTKALANSAPDGYTIGLGYTGTLAIGPNLYANVGYDPRKDFAPVGLIATSALVVLVNPAVEAKTIPELIALAKREPGKLNYASAGTGSGIHLGAALLAHMAGITLTHIPYKGSAPALTDLLGGHVAIYLSSLPPAVALVRDGKVRALAVTGPQRSPVFPDLPTVAEAALPGYEAVLHYGIVAPAGTPKPIIEKLSVALKAALREPDVRERIEADGAELASMTPAEYAADIDREETKWSAIVKLSGARVE